MKRISKKLYTPEFRVDFTTEKSLLSAQRPKHRSPKISLYYDALTSTRIKN